MSLWIVRIIGPSGRKTYLFRGREIERRENATVYSSPSAAKKAREQYFDKLNAICKVIPCMIVEIYNDSENIL